MSDLQEPDQSEEYRAVSHPLLKVVGFSLLLTLSFTWIAHLLPQIEGEAPTQESTDFSGMNKEQFVALGEELYRGKGNCTLCHNELDRAPDLLQLHTGDLIKGRLADPNYRGKSQSIESYLMESMIDPGIYVVSGYGQKGSNDTISPMHAADKPPISLNLDEMNAIIAFLQDKDGLEITVPLPQPGEVAEENDPVTPQAEPPPITPVESDRSAETLLSGLGCIACHSVLNSTSTIGPDLRNIGQRLGREELREGILFPDKSVTEGYYPGMMPKDYGTKMQATELEGMLDYLLQ